jgi:OmcA/MtrC family decaheme c-type cytochrome
MVATGYTARRVITDTAKCTKCHDQLGADPSFHGGARNDPTACAICHNTNKTSNGWTANANTFIHGIHGASKRSVPFTWATATYQTIGYPGLLKDCNQCHLPNTVNLGATGGTTLAPNMLWPTEASGTYTASTKNSPYVAVATTPATNYGNYFTYTPAGATASAYTTAAGIAVPAQVAPAGGLTVIADTATLVSSPISSACFACHDTSNAKNHMVSNGGVVYGTRASAGAAATPAVAASGTVAAVNAVPLTGLTNREDCLTCHGAGRVADAAVIHTRK